MAIGDEHFIRAFSCLSLRALSWAAQPAAAPAACRLSLLSLVRRPAGTASAGGTAHGHR